MTGPPMHEQHCGNLFIHSFHALKLGESCARQQAFSKCVALWGCVYLVLEQEWLESISQVLSHADNTVTNAGGVDRPVPICTHAGSVRSREAILTMPFISIPRCWPNELCQIHHVFCGKKAQYRD